MGEEQRPACVTVIGWIWIIIGALSLFLTIGYVMSSLLVYLISLGAKTNVPVEFRSILVRAAVDTISISISAFVIVLGVYFLKLRSWTRRMMEILTWLYLISGLINYIYDFDGYLYLIIFGFVYAILCFIPAVIMLKYLRSDVVKNALIIQDKTENAISAS